MTKRNDNQKKIAKTKARNKRYINKKNYVTKTLCKDYHTQKKSKGK